MVYRKLLQGFSILILVLFATKTFSGENRKPDPEYSLQRSINRLLNSKQHSRATTSIKIISAETGDVLYERNGDLLLTPASTMKSITSVAALAKLGPTYKFKTTISTDDTTHAVERINGNLYIKGFGDPYLTSSDLKTIAQYLRASGITQINGNIIGDDSFFDQLYYRKDWSDEYTSIKVPPLSALTVDQNRLIVSLGPGRRKGEELQISTEPNLPFIKIVNQGLTVNYRVRSKPVAKARWDNAGLTLTILGKMSLGGKVRSYNLDAKSPAWFAATIFKSQLQQVGIQVSGIPKVGATPFLARELVRNESPISAVIAGMNKESDNFAADMVLKTLGAEMTKQPGSIENGLMEVKAFLTEIGIPSSAYRIFDGSGISHKNGISANAFVRMLHFMYQRKDLFEIFYNSLATAGVDGTLKERMTRTEAAHKLHAKTGTLRGTTSLVGYVTSADNEMLIFAITSQVYVRKPLRYRSIQDHIGALLANYSKNKYSQN